MSQQDRQRLLEELAEPGAEPYALPIDAHGVIDWGPMLREMLADPSDAPRIASRLHASLVHLIVRLSERHLKSDPPSAAERAALDADIDAHLAPLALPSGAALVAVAGTATNLAAADLAMERYEPERIHGHVMTPAALAELTDRLFAATIAARREIVGIEPQRADVIAGGAAIFTRLAARLAAPRVVVSDRGIRWGLAYEVLTATS